MLLPPRSAVLLVLSLATVLAGVPGCGIDEDVVAREAAASREAVPSEPEREPEREPEPEPEPVGSPFTLDVPEGYDLVVEGRGEEDRRGETAATAVTVLAPGGEPVGTGVVLVESVPSPASPDPGRRPGYREAAAGRWSALTVPGLRAWGVEATEAELRDVLDATRAPTEPGAAPTVEEPPGDLEVVGSITVDGVMALGIELPPADEDAESVPGPRSAHVAAWRGENATLVAVTLPAGALDPAAVVTEVRPPRRTGDEPRDATAEEVETSAGRGTVTSTADGETGRVVRRSLAVETEGGDVLLLISRGPDLLDTEALVAVAESVE